TQPASAEQRPWRPAPQACGMSTVSVDNRVHKPLMVCRGRENTGPARHMIVLCPPPGKYPAERHIPAIAFRSKPAQHAGKHHIYRYRNDNGLTTTESSMATITPLAPVPAGSALKPVPGDTGLPLIGNTLPMMRDPVTTLRQRYDRFGPVSWSH